MATRLRKRNIPGDYDVLDDEGQVIGLVSSDGESRPMWRAYTVDASLTDVPEGQRRTPAGATFTRRHAVEKVLEALSEDDVDVFELARDGRGWRVRKIKTGALHSARIADKDRAQRQVDTMNAKMRELKVNRY